MFHQCPQSSLPIILKVSLCWDPVPVTWLVLKRNNSQYFPSLAGCFPAKLTAFSTWGNFTWSVAVCSASSPKRQNYTWSRQQETFLLHGPPGSLSQGTKGDQQRKKGTCKQTQNFCPNVLMPTRILQAASKFFWEFVSKYISVLHCIDSEQNCNIFETIALALIQ